MTYMRAQEITVLVINRKGNPLNTGGLPAKLLVNHRNAIDKIQALIQNSQVLRQHLQHVSTGD